MLLLLMHHYNIAVNEFITFSLEYQRAYLKLGGIEESVDIEKGPAGES